MSYLSIESQYPTVTLIKISGFWSCNQIIRNLSKKNLNLYP